MRTILTILIFVFAFSFVSGQQMTTKEFFVYFEYNSSIIEQEIPAEITTANVISIVGYASEEGTTDRNKSLSYSRATAVADKIGFDTMLNLRHVKGDGATKKFGSRSKNRVVVITYEIESPSKMTEFDCNPRQTTKREQRFNEKRDAKLAEIRARDTFEYYVNIFGDTVNLDGTLRNPDTTKFVSIFGDTINPIPNVITVIDTVLLIDTINKTDTVYTEKVITIMDTRDAVRFLVTQRGMSPKEARNHVDKMSQEGRIYDMQTLTKYEKANSFDELKRREEGKTSRKAIRLSKKNAKKTIRKSNRPLGYLFRKTVSQVFPNMFCRRSNK